ncbi:MAG: DUF202 domain-containing protein [Lapillicoccus sp.]
MEKRWPGWVYDEGSEPDPRFSFANERTLLAWVRTGLALLAGGVALHAFPLSISPNLRRGSAVLLVVLGVVAVVAGWLRWASSERAMRRGDPLPGFALAGALTALVIIAALVLLVITLSP